MKGTVAAVGLSLLLAACGSEGGGGQELSVRARPTLGLGETVTLASGESVQVRGYQAGVRPERHGPDGGDVRTFAVIDVEACADGDGRSGAEPARFHLEMADNSRVSPVPIVAREPALRLPTSPGECTRGTISYELQAGRNPVAVSFAATADTTVRWRVA